MTRDDVIKALSLCRYDPDPGQECKQLVSCDICPYWSDETGCRMTDLFTDALALLKEEPRPLSLDDVLQIYHTIERVVTLRPYSIDNYGELWTLYMRRPDKEDTKCET